MGVTVACWKVPLQHETSRDSQHGFQGIYHIPREFRSGNKRPGPTEGTQLNISGRAHQSSGDHVRLYDCCLRVHDPELHGSFCRHSFHAVHLLLWVSLPTHFLFVSKDSRNTGAPSKRNLVGALLPGLPCKDKALICLSAGLRRSLDTPNTYWIASTSCRTGMHGVL